MDVTTEPDGVARCAWCAGTSEYRDYHDADWGFPVIEDRRLFEKITLESFQSGLSWRTILQKRNGFRTAFAMFDFDKISGFGPDEVNALLQDTSIVRHRGKIEATINNARRAQEIRSESGSLAAYFWRYEEPERIAGTAIPTASPTAMALSKDLRKRGWKFVGPTTCYAFMQAAGLVNDHAEACASHGPAQAARVRLTRP